VKGRAFGHSRELLLLDSRERVSRVGTLRSHRLPLAGSRPEEVVGNDAR